MLAVLLYVCLLAVTPAKQGVLDWICPGPKSRCLLCLSSSSTAPMVANGSSFSLCLNPIRNYELFAPSAYTDLILVACSELALKKSMLSSRNNKWEIGGACRVTRSGRIAPSISCFFNSIDKLSAANKNRYGESGSPWCNPRDGWNRSVRTPLKFTAKRTVVTHATHHPFHRFAMKAHLQYNSSQQSQSTRS